MEYSRGCAWCQELLFVIAGLTISLLGIFMLALLGEMLAYHEAILPVALFIACGLVGCVTSVLVSYQRFQEAPQSRWMLLVCGILYVCCSLVSYIFLDYYTRRLIHMGRMSAYFTNPLDKEMIDKTQMLFQCCGEVSYTDWFRVEWQGAAFESVRDCDMGELVSRTAVPFSCCDPAAASPCVHNYLELDQDARLYRGGCKHALVAAARIMGHITALILITLGILMLLWAFCSRDDDYCTYSYSYSPNCDGVSDEYCGKVSVLMPAADNFQEISAQAMEGATSVPLSVPPAEQSPYTSPEERHFLVLRAHEESLMEISPSGFLQRVSSTQGESVQESLYSAEDAA